MALSDTNLRERKFHNELHSSGKERAQNKFYKALYNLNKDFINHDLVSHYIIMFLIFIEWYSITFMEKWFSKSLHLQSKDLVII